MRKLLASLGVIILAGCQVPTGMDEEEMMDDAPPPPPPPPVEEIDPVPADFAEVAPPAVVAPPPTDAAPPPVEEVPATPEI
jgi:hypothetical protein